jgi:hypothetical protein
MSIVTLSGRIERLIILHGGLRATSRATSVDVGYLKKMRDGGKNKS